MRQNTPVMRRLMQDERGAGYSVSVLLILPIFIISLAFAVELLFITKAYMALHASEAAAVHAVHVWLPQRSALQTQGSSMDAKVHESVVRSMLPFASLGKAERATDTRLEPALQAVDLTPKAVARFGHNYAALKDLISVQVEDSIGDQPGFVVTIRYEVPLYFSYFGPIFATEQTEDGPVRVIESHRYVPIPRSQFRDENLGIPYRVTEVQQW